MWHIRTQWGQNSRYVHTITVWSLLLGVVVLSLCGCGGSDQRISGKMGAYDAYYRNGLSRLPGLTYSTVHENGDVWTYSKPYDVVLDSVLGVVSQYQGILSLELGDSQCVMLVVKARERTHAPEDEIRTATFGGFYERWSAVGIKENTDTGQTEVVVADLSPSTGRLGRNEGTSEMLFSQIQVQLSQLTWHMKFVGFESAGGENDAVDAGDPSRRKAYRYDELENQLGDWIARRMQIDLLTVDCPEATVWLEGVVRRLKSGSDLQDLPTRVVVVNSRQLNAFALPNGDIFVASGLLDCLDTEDEVAAVLAHELDHLAHHDVINRMRKKRSGEASAGTLRMAVAFGDLAVSMFTGSSGLGTAIVTDIAGAGARGLAERHAHHLEFGMVSGYAADIELRADVNGMKMMRAAKYDPDANVRMLYTLKDFQAEAEGRSEFYRSNLINMEPGLDERIEALKNALSEGQ